MTLGAGIKGISQKMKWYVAALGFLATLLPQTASAASTSRVESYVEAPGPAGPLKGTMLSSGKGEPAVLIIPGSGPTDRDGNNGISVKASTYKLLAEALADRGVASVRIDKRGMFASRAAVPDANSVTIDAYAEDAHAWAIEIKKLTGNRCVWLLGHSEGALVALAATRDPKDICGVILAAGAGRRLSELMREQLRANPANAPILPTALKAIDELEAGRRVDVAGMHPALAQLFAPPVQDFMINEMSYDPAALVKAYPGRVLVLQGTTDLQVSMADAEKLAAARPGVALTKLDGVNHVLKAAPAERLGNTATYADPSLPLAPGVADAIATFIKAR